MQGDDSFIIEGKEGKAFQFDGQDDYFYVRHIDDYNFGAKSFTISMWLKLDENPGSSYLFSKGRFPDEASAEGYALYTTADDEIVFHCGDGEYESTVAASVSAFVTGDWVKLTAIRNRDKTQLQLYKNADKIATEEDESWSVDNVTKVYVAAKSDGSHYYSGGMDNIRLMNYALETDKIGQLHTTDIEDSRKPEKYTLDLKNYPNPFNPVTKINYVVPNKEQVTLQVYNIQGELVKILVDNKLRTAGNHSINFDGSSLSSGIYISRLKVGDQYKTQKMMLIK